MSFGATLSSDDLSSGLRRRNVELTTMGEDKSNASFNVKKFDFYSKVEDDFRVKTHSGGAISMISISIIIILFISELKAYLTSEVMDHIVVDTTLDQKLPISLNITFPHLRCDEVSVDTVDSAGENQINIHGTLNMYELDKYGLPSSSRLVKVGECLSCLEATQTQCCNTCADLKSAYINEQLSYSQVLEDAEQCRSIVGCNVHGDVLVSKVAGNVHVALGKSTVRNGRHVHEFNIKDVSDGFNTSHTIHRLRFGDTFDGLVASPLEGVRKTVHNGAFMYHYYIKLVPTIFLDEEDPEASQVYSHQYSVTESNKNVLVSEDQLSGLPGVFLVYEFYPFLVQKRKKWIPFAHFITSVCAIIGGIFTVSSLLDRLVYKGGKRLFGIKSLTL